MTDTFQSFLEKWSTPAIFIFLVTITWGAIQWGNKLTDESIQAAKERGALSAELEFVGNKLWADDNRNIAINAKQTEILNGMLRQIDSMDGRANRAEDRMGRNESLIIENQRDAHTHNGQE